VIKLILAALAAVLSIDAHATSPASAPAPSNPWARIPQTQAEADAMHGITPIPRTRTPKPAFVPTLPEAPQGLSAQHTGTWNAYRKLPGIRSIKIVSFDPTLLNGNSITINQDGKSIVLKGQSAPDTLEVPNAQGIPVEQRIVWTGRSDDGRSEATVIYELRTNVVVGSFHVDGRSFSLSGPGNAPFWLGTQPVEIDEPEGMSAPRPKSPASAPIVPGKQK
jgi:hypothetical protein